jgi:LPXTG-motif cell wall-anchored protein
LGIETVAQRSAPAPAEEETGGSTLPYVLAGAGVVALLVLGFFLFRRRSARGTDEDQI